VILLLAALASAPPQSADTVHVVGGLVAGVVAPSGVREFRGIPFAAPPVGRGRWQPPAPVPAWQGVKDASHFGSRCMQLPIYSDMNFRSPGTSEDCLTLNVWVPAHAAVASPVLLYFYGGGFQAGDASEYRYDGESLARRGIIVVTANYRLGVFGFFAHPSLTLESRHHSSGDYGLLDQIEALRWVRANIAKFKGDPKRITIGGESAGSISVTALMVSPLSRDLIAGAIGESGGLLPPTFTSVPLTGAEQVGLDFGRSLGDPTLRALRAIPAESLLARSQGHRFPIAVDHWVLTEPPESTLAAGKQAHVPLLAGWNSEEGSWHSILGSDPPTPEHYAAAIGGLYGADSGRVLAAFPGQDSDQVKASATLLAGARYTAYGTWSWARLAAHTGKKPVYVYLYTHPRPGATGAVHSAEIEYALGNLATNHVYAWTADDSTVSQTMETYFAAFIKTGNPNTRGLPGWPALNAGAIPQVMVLEVHPSAGPPPFARPYHLLDSLYGNSPH